eukprot:TRINITY_DN582_c0_g2_i1.p1 TRINITY_DN582_c0_g2~~TRINITY_DN582_c0_g2_i1.p1  ORF type:complete len:205 (+),score=51.14 TRINITY_DN582_c0_g2_i1:264-878(+)
MEEVFKIVQENSKNAVTNNYDSLVLLIHAIVVQNGFQLIAIAEQGGPQVQGGNLPEEWNPSGVDSWTFKYAAGDTKILAKVIRMGKNIIVNCLNLDGDSTISVQIDVQKYVENLEYKNVSDLMEVIKTDILVPLKVLPQGAEQENVTASNQSNTTGSRTEGRNPNRFPPQHYDPLRVYDERNYPSNIGNPFRIGSEDLGPMLVD